MTDDHHLDRIARALELHFMLRLADSILPTPWESLTDADIGRFVGDCALLGCDRTNAENLARALRDGGTYGGASRE